MTEKMDADIATRRDVVDEFGPLARNLHHHLGDRFLAIPGGAFAAILDILLRVHVRLHDGLKPILPRIEAAEVMRRTLLDGRLLFGFGLVPWSGEGSPGRDGQPAIPDDRRGLGDLLRHRHGPAVAPVVGRPVNQIVRLVGGRRPCEVVVRGNRQPILVPPVGRHQRMAWRSLRLVADD